MAITNTPAASAQGEGASLTLAYECSGDNRALLVGISYIDDGNVLASVTYGGVPLILQRSCYLGQKMRLVDGVWVSERPAIHQEMWVLPEPLAGTADVVVTFSSVVKAVVHAVGFAGVSQTAPVYFTNDGVGDMVTEIPLAVDLRNGDAMVGSGCAYADTSSPLLPGQVELWNTLYAATGEFRTQCLMLIPNFSVVGTITNVLPIPAPWAVNLVGLSAAA